MKEFIFDIETFQFRAGNKLPRAVAFAYQIGNEEPEVLSFFYDRDKIRQLFEEALRSGAMIIGHNIAFDMGVMWNEFAYHYPHISSLIMGAYNNGRVHCTAIEEKLRKIGLGRFRFDSEMNIQPRFSLDELAKEYCGVDIKSWKKGPDVPRSNYHTVAHLPVCEWPKGFVKYAAMDVDLTGQIYRYQVASVPLAADNQPVITSQSDWEEQMKSGFLAQVVSSTGIMRDAAAVDELEEEFNRVIDEAMGALLEAGVYTEKKKGGFKKNTKKIQELVEEAYDGHPPKTEPSKTYPDGQISTSTETLKSSGDATLELLASVASTIASKNKDIPLLRNNIDYPLTPRVNSLQITGRWSTSKPNIQNFPRIAGVRECFVARKGRVFCSVDYDSLEVRAWARACKEIIGYSKALERYLEDPHWDPYCEHLVMSLELPYDELVAGKSKKYKNDRTRAKPIVLGCPGGMGIETLMESAKDYGVYFTYDEAKHERDIWRETFPEGRELLEWGGDISNTHGVIRLWWVDGMVKGDSGYCDGANFTFQGPAAKGAKLAGWRLFEATLDSNSPLYGSTMPIFAHDEWIMGHREEVAHEAAMEQVRIMTEAMEDVLEVPITCEAALMRKWSKKAFTYYDESGRLRPYEDAAA